MSGKTRTSVSVYLLPGMTAKITAPKAWVGKGTHHWQDSQGNWTKIDANQNNAYHVEDEDIGRITKVYDDGVAVNYTHKKFGQNRVIFTNRYGEFSYVDIISVPIHDHSSIVQGGPAYGTYFVDDELQENQEEKGG